MIDVTNWADQPPSFYQFRTLHAVVKTNCGRTIEVTARSQIMNAPRPIAALQMEASRYIVSKGYDGMASIKVWGIE
jgi:hypothetical protein